MSQSRISAIWWSSISAGAWPQPGISATSARGPRAAISAAVSASSRPEDVDLWALWDLIAIPVLVLRGATSDLLLAETAAEMAARGPRAEVAEIPGCGHAPALMDDHQIALVRDWLMADA